MPVAIHLQVLWHWFFNIEVNAVKVIPITRRCGRNQPDMQHNAVALVNSLRPRPNRCHFADDTFKCIFEKENEWISPRISLKFVPKVRINNIPALVQIMAWCRPGDKPLSEPMMVSLLTHICVTRPQWFKSSPPGQNGHYFTDNIFGCIFMNWRFCILIKISLKFVLKGPIDNNPGLVWIMARHQIGAKPLSEPILTQFTDAYMQH